jgi:hypothetical protein
VTGQPRGAARYGIEVVTEAGDDEHVLTLRYDVEGSRFRRPWELT